MEQDVPNQRYTIIKEIGRGATSRVLLARSKFLTSVNELDLVAIKEINIHNKCNLGAIYQEAQILRRLKEN